MSNYLLVNKILSKIEFKIEPNKNIRKEYLYRIKKNFYKLIHLEKKFVVLSSLAIIRPIDSVIDSSFLKYVLKNPLKIEPRAWTLQGHHFC